MYNFYLWQGFLQIIYLTLSSLFLFIFIQYPICPSKRLTITLRPVLFVSSISYPLYLLHQKIGYVIIINFMRYTHITSEWLLFIPFAVVLPLAWMIHKKVEVRF